MLSVPLIAARVVRRTDGDTPFPDIVAEACCYARCCKPGTTPDPERAGRRLIGAPACARRRGNKALSSPTTARAFAAAAEIARGKASRGALTIVNVNNHYEGCAPLTAETFLRLLGEEDGESAG